MVEVAVIWCCTNALSDRAAEAGQYADQSDVAGPPIPLTTAVAGPFGLSF